MRTLDRMPEEVMLSATLIDKVLQIIYNELLLTVLYLTLVSAHYFDETPILRRCYGMTFT